MYLIWYTTIMRCAIAWALALRFARMHACGGQRQWRDADDLRRNIYQPKFMYSYARHQMCEQRIYLRSALLRVPHHSQQQSSAVRRGTENPKQNHQKNQTRNSLVRVCTPPRCASPMRGSRPRVPFEYGLAKNRLMWRAAAKTTTATRSTTQNQTDNQQIHKHNTDYSNLKHDCNNPRNVFLLQHKIDNK